MTDVTRILSAIEQGDPQAAAELLPLVYNELRKLAAQKLAHELLPRKLCAARVPNWLRRFLPLVHMWVRKRRPRRLKRSIGQVNRPGPDGASPRRQGQQTNHERGKAPDCAASWAGQTVCQLTDDGRFVGSPGTADFVSGHDGV